MKQILLIVGVFLAICSVLIVVISLLLCLGFTKEERQDKEEAILPKQEISFHFESLEHQVLETDTIKIDLE